jgi:hypothetical protein
MYSRAFEVILDHARMVDCCNDHHMGDHWIGQCVKPSIILSRTTTRQKRIASFIATDLYQRSTRAKDDTEAKNFA